MVLSKQGFGCIRLFWVMLNWLFLVFWGGSPLDFSKQLIEKYIQGRLKCIELSHIVDVHVFCSMKKTIAADTFALINFASWIWSFYTTRVFVVGYNRHWKSSQRYSLTTLLLFENDFLSKFHTQNFVYNLVCEQNEV
jgi:hypothetical protein